jgi:regulator of telomere elongation helicase 1
MLDEYLSIIKTKGKAAFFAVCRGKLAEGIDFVDDAARAVIICGIPYPQVYDPKVLIKKDFLDRKCQAARQSNQMS